jgi:hypothetical protein
MARAAFLLVLAGLLGAAVRLSAAQPAKPAAPADDPGAADPAEATPPAKPPAKTSPPAAKPGAAKPAPGPQFRSEQVDETQKRQRTEVLKILRSQAVAADQAKTLDAYYTTYAFPRWTLPQNYAQIASEFSRDLVTELKTAQTGPTYDHVMRLALKFLGDAVNDKALHPAVRYNAMLMLGRLNVKEPALGAVREAIQPHPEALKIMLAALRDANQADAVRVAALLGVARHAQLGAADAQVLNVLVQLATAKDPPQGRSPEGHAWIRGRAIDALAELRDAAGKRVPGADAQAVKAVSTVLAETTAPIHPTRLAAARALGSFDYSTVAGIKPADLAILLAGLTVEACTTELKRDVPLTSAAGMTPGSPMSSGMSRMGMAPGMAPGMVPGMGMQGPMEEGADERCVLFRRRLKAVLGAVQLAFIGPDRTSGLKGWASGKPDQGLVDLVDRQIAAQIKELDDEELPYDKLKAAIAKHRIALKKLLADPDAAVKAAKAAEAEKKKPGGK